MSKSIDFSVNINEKYVKGTNKVKPLKNDNPSIVLRKNQNTFKKNIQQNSQVSSTTNQESPFCKEFQELLSSNFPGYKNLCLETSGQSLKQNTEQQNKFNVKKIDASEKLTHQISEGKAIITNNGKIVFVN